jgi:hypothetical protein
MRAGSYLEVTFISCVKEVNPLVLCKFSRTTKAMTSYHHNEKQTYNLSFYHIRTRYSNFSRFSSKLLNR